MEETKQKFKQTKFISEARVLLGICEKHFNCSLKDKDRHRNNVNARVAFAVILRKRGHCYTKIGNQIGRSHATIIHYKNKAEMFLSTDEDFRMKFDLTRQEFEEKCIASKLKKYANYVEKKDKENYYLALPLYNKDLLNHISLLNKQKKELYSQIESLKLNEVINDSSSERVQNLIDIVKQRTRLGSEKVIEKKLNIWYNGLEN